MYKTLLEKIRTKKAIIGICGVGYIGSALMERLLEEGFSIFGFDVDKAKSKLYQGRVSNRFGNLAICDIIIIAVPTPLTHELEGKPDLSPIIETSKTIASIMKPGCLVCSESTSYPGTLRDVIKPILDKAGVPYYLASSPERIDPGSSHTIKDTPKLCSGIDPESTSLAVEFYEYIVETVVQTSTPEIAEFAKILENTFRLVNIALVNECSRIAEIVGINIWEVIESADTKPFGFMKFEPGPGVGGSCIPVDPHYLLKLAEHLHVSTPLIKEATNTNEMMCYNIANRIRLLTYGKNIHFVGITYKKNTAITKESTFSLLYDLLTERNYNITYHDPLVPKYKDLTSEPLKTLKNKDLVIIFTDHDGIDWKQIVKQSQKVLDLRGITHKLHIVDPKITLL